MQHACTSDDLWGHVSNGAHGIGESVLQLLGCTKVTELEQQTILEQQHTER